jgi:hypothetical protein
MSNWTVAKEPSVEEQVSHAAFLLRSAIQLQIPPEQLRVAAIIGGYGRGEGGVQRCEGEPRPHNNIDVLVVTAGQRQMKADCQKALRDVTKQVEEVCGIPVDIGCVTEYQLENSRPRVMWYDVRHGHRVLCGDASFLSGLKRYRADNIPVDDVIDLVTNRGALAVIAKELILAPSPSIWGVKHALKGTMKAIVGFGDAILWQDGLYDVSYQEKATRMAQARGVDPGLRRLYAEAVAFRFQPNYEDYEGRESEWILAAIEELEKAHRSFAAGILQRKVSWGVYDEAILRLCLRERGIRAWISHTRTELQNYWHLGRTSQPSDSWLERASLPRHRLAASLPHALYQADRRERLKFIQAWALACDVNFPEQLGQELKLEEVA